MTLADLGSILQIVGGLIELGGLVWAARTVERALRKHRNEDRLELIDTQADVMILGVSGGNADDARKLVTRFIQSRIDRLYEAIEDVVSSPVRLFGLGLFLSVLGALLSAGWFD